MGKKEIIAMLLAGGQGSRLGILTQNKAKPGVSFGGKYKFIDFPLSNCINSGIDTVGIVTQYKPLSLTQHIGIGIPWDLDKKYGGLSILSPYMREKEGNWFLGTAHAVYSNMEYIESYNPEYILILSADHIYKMNYSKMLDFHKKNNADASIAVVPVDINDAKRFGILNVDENNKVYEFEEKPEEPKSNLASMGIYIFNWKILKEALISDRKNREDSDFGAHIIPNLIDDNKKLFAYEFNSYWKDVGTIESYWEANLDLVKTVPEFNLYEDSWNIYTNSNIQSPHYLGDSAVIRSALIGDGCEIEGTVLNSIIGDNVVIKKGVNIENSIILDSCVIEKNTRIEKSIICEKTKIGSDTIIGNNQEVGENKIKKIYNSGITVIGEKTKIPSGVNIGNNCVIWGNTDESMYQNKKLESGKNLINYKEEARWKP